jgi:hypothetical protein
MLESNLVIFLLMVFQEYLPFRLDELSDKCLRFSSPPQIQFSGVVKWN